MQQGVICGLTNAIADFQDTCATFEEDVTLKEKEEALAVTRVANNNVASQGKRFTNRLIDFIFIMILGFVIGMILALVSPNTLHGLEQGGKLTEYAFGILVGMIYYTLFEMITGRTLGKLITGTKVVDEQGNMPQPERILLRSLCRYIPFDAFSFLGGDGTGWHDTLSKTRVVEA